MCVRLCVVISVLSVCDKFIYSFIHLFIWDVIFLFVQLFSNSAITSKLTVEFGNEWVCVWGIMKGNYVKTSAPNLEVRRQAPLLRSARCGCELTAASNYTKCICWWRRAQCGFAFLSTLPSFSSDRFGYSRRHFARAHITWRLPFLMNFRKTFSVDVSEHHKTIPCLFQFICFGLVWFSWASTFFSSPHLYFESNALKAHKLLWHCYIEQFCAICGNQNTHTK